MIDPRTSIPIACLLVTATITLAQTPPAPLPAPLAPLVDVPTPPAAPRAPRAPFVAAPTPPPAPAAPWVDVPTPPAAPQAPFVSVPTPPPAPTPRAFSFDPGDLDALRELADQAREAAQIDPERLRELAEQAREMAMQAPKFQIDQDQLREMAEQAREMAMQAPKAQIDPDTLRELADEARQKALAAQDALREDMPLFKLAHPSPTPEPSPLFKLTNPKLGEGLGSGFGLGLGDGKLFAQARVYAGRNGQSDDRLYNAGHSALDNHRYDEALDDFNQVASHAGARADAALYFKAYTLNKLNRGKEALAAIAELRKSYTSSRWLDDAKALELDVNQRAGRPVSPEAESDEELKLIAINSIMQSDPERAIPLLENILKSTQPPKVKDRALFVLAQSSAPRAQQVIEQIARGGANPDLQLKAINYLSQRRRQGNQNPNLLPEIYGATTDVNVKRAILNAYRSSNDKEHLAQIARTEKTPELRRDAFQSLGNNPGQPELWPIFQAETSPDTRQDILRCMYQDGNAEKLAEVVRTEKDPKTRRVAIEVLSTQRGANTGDLLVSVYSSEQDPQVKQTIIDHLSNDRNAKYLVELARAEKDSKMKVRIVDRLSNMHSKEASDYLMELLSK